MRHFLDFEKPIAELEGKIEELRRTTDAGGIDVAEEVGRLRDKAQALLKATYAKLTPWQKAQVARHPDRPHCRDYVAALMEDYTPLAGDRAFADDAAVMGGMGRFRGRAVMVLGTERGHDTESRVEHNFGMARPEGYRKARRLMELAGRFGLPILSFVDTAGAFPGIEAEARGQAEAIARSIEAGLEAPVPFIATIIGEGGSGGAIALAAADRIIMLEHATGAGRNGRPSR
jgi:acetyl-CoA carboxylase carboxyl transferase subunit alpha